MASGAFHPGVFQGLNEAFEVLELGRGDFHPALFAINPDKSILKTLNGGNLNASALSVFFPGH
jgi:hypothetical protein